MEALKNIATQASAGHGAPKGAFQNILGPGATEQDMKALTQQADSLWKFLDELAETNPEEYARFIEKQATALKEEAQAKQDPRIEGVEPYLIVDTRKANAVPAQACSFHVWAVKEGCGVATAVWGTHCPSSTSASSELCIPVAELKAPEPERRAQNSGVAVYTMHVACHGMTLRQATQPGAYNLLGLLVEALYQYAHSKYALLLDRDARSIRVSPSLLSAEQLSRIDAARQQNAVERAVSGTAAADLPQGVLSQLVKPQASNRARAKAPPKAPMIIDLGDAPRCGEAPNASCQLQSTCIMQDGLEYVVMEAHLPDVRKAKEVEVEVVGGNVLSITLPSGSQLSSAIPKPILEGSVAAKFDKAKKLLSITMQVA